MHICVFRPQWVNSLRPSDAYICVGNLTIIGSDNGLSPGRRQAIIWTNVRILSIGPPVTNFSEILMEILSFSFKKMRLKVSSVKRWSFCLGLNVLRNTKSETCWLAIRSECVGKRQPIYASFAWGRASITPQNQYGPRTWQRHDKDQGPNLRKMPDTLSLQGALTEGLVVCKEDETKWPPFCRRRFSWHTVIVFWSKLDSSLFPSFK